MTVLGCNTQVNNRDLSIAVLRAFISKHKQEHEAKISRRAKSAQKISENNGSEIVMDEASNESATNDEKCNTDCDAHEKLSNECGSPMLPEEQKENVEGKERRDAKPIRVLEVLLISLIIILCARAEFNHSLLFNDVGSIFNLGTCHA